MKQKRIYHLPWTKHMTEDDKKIQNLLKFKDKRFVYLEKLDGENTIMSNNNIHARSETSYFKPWQTYMKSEWGRIKHNIPDDMYICGENLFAVHSIEYDNLPAYFFVFDIVLNGIHLPWSDVRDWCELLGFNTCPCFKVDILDIMPIPKHSHFGNECEGYVIRNFDSFKHDDYNENVAKVVRENHIKTDERWENNWRKAKLNEMV